MARQRHPQLDLDEQLCFALYDAQRAVTRLYQPLLSELGLTYPQYLVMLVLWADDAPVSVGELGARLHLDSGTLTPLLKRLEQQGVVERRRDPADERRVLISLTDDGAALREPAADVPRCLVESMGVGLGEVIGLRDRLKELTASIERTSSPPE
jgi:DNA-binding MarR family transcriptional regulator